ncbi:MAG: hypothetical protein QOF09_5437 [Alphaproteobacteria bacterium]|nr:hypothetical protein [Alphaproteobacteria bacterium]
MSRKRTTALLLGFLIALNAGALLLNVALPSRAAIAGMGYEDLVRDPDFARAVRTIVQGCAVNVDVAKVRC